MLTPTQILTEAATALLSKTSSRPNPETVINTLLEAEKVSRKPSKSAHSDRDSQQETDPDPEQNANQQTTFTDLIGCWRLCFVTGTQKIREKAGRKIGPGRYIPRWVEIRLSYAHPKSDEQLVDPSDTEFDPGLVENSVRIGQLQLVLTGPTKFLQHRSILAFDFTQVMVTIGPWTIYRGSIRGRSKQDHVFFQQGLKQQAFFTYFLIHKDVIAARGRGGGLALWGKIE